MIDVASLAQQAMTVLGPLLPLAASSAAGQVAAGFFRQPGAKLYDWMASKVKGTPAAATLDRAVAEPQDRHRLDALRGEIEELAEKDAEFRDQLAALLEEIAAATGAVTATQTATQTGDNNKSAQVAGSNNSTQIG